MAAWRVLSALDPARWVQCAAVVEGDRDRFWHAVGIGAALVG